jgi:hypothetical protein
MKPKYGNKKTDGYDSMAEARRAFALKLLEKAGKISDLQEQVSFVIIPKQPGELAARYVADFTYWQGGRFVVEDVKSPATKRLPAYILKRKLMLYVHGIAISEVA